MLAPKGRNASRHKKKRAKKKKSDLRENASEDTGRNENLLQKSGGKKN